MRLLNRNKQKFYHSEFVSYSPVVDEYGNETGESRITYSTPTSCRGNISAARGSADVREFGEDLNYDRVIVLDDPDTTIDEHSILWIQCSPDNDTPHDHVVRKVARSLNSVSIAVSKVIVG